MSNSLDSYLILSGLLFAVGTFGFLARRNAISMLMSIELMINAVNLSIVAFGAFVPPLNKSAAVIALLVIAIAAAGLKTVTSQSASWEMDKANQVAASRPVATGSQPRAVQRWPKLSRTAAKFQPSATPATIKAASAPILAVVKTFCTSLP